MLVSASRSAEPGIAGCQRLAEQRPSRLDEAGLEEAEQFGVAFFFGEQRAEDGQRGKGSQVVMEVLQDRQGVGARGRGAGGRVLDPERADHRGD